MINEILPLLGINYLLYLLHYIICEFVNFLFEIGAYLQASLVWLYIIPIKSESGYAISFLIKKAAYFSINCSDFFLRTIMIIEHN